MNSKTIKDSLIGLFLGMGIMLCAYYLIPKESILKLFPNTPLETLVFFSSVILCPFFAIFLHELGHLIAGLIQGFKLQLFVVAFLGIKREDDKVKFYFNKELQFFGGIAATSPPKVTNNLKKQFAYILIAGPLSSLIFAGTEVSEEFIAKATEVYTSAVLSKVNEQLEAVEAKFDESLTEEVSTASEELVS